MNHVRTVLKVETREDKVRLTGKSMYNLDTEQRVRPTDMYMAYLVYEPLPNGTFMLHKCRQTDKDVVDESEMMAILRDTLNEPRSEIRTVEDS